MHVSINCEFMSNRMHWSLERTVSQVFINLVYGELVRWCTSHCIYQYSQGAVCCSGGFVGWVGLVGWFVVHVDGLWGLCIVAWIYLYNLKYL